MRISPLGATVVALLLTAGCKGEGPKGQPPVDTRFRAAAAPTDRAAAMTAQFDSALAEQGIRLDNTGHLVTQAAAGFEIYWPSGCGQLRAGEPDVVDPDATQEFIYSCDRFKKLGTGCSVYVLQNGRTEDGGPPSPAMVVERVEDFLTRYEVRAERQRPLSAPGIEGVDVQAVEPAGRGEVWVRGLLAGTHVYILAAWNKEGGLFEDAEVRDFFASFRLIQ